MDRRSAALTLTFVLTADPAQAGNDDGVLLGDAAILSGGALVTRVRDGSALWYNPAGLAEAQAIKSFDLSGSAFLLRHYSASNLLVSPEADAETASFLELLVVPSVLAFVRPLSDRLTGAFAVFVNDANDLTLQSTVTIPGDRGPTEWLFATSSVATLYHAGPGIGWKVTDTLSLGASVFVVYARSLESVQLAGGIPSETESGGFVAVTSRTDQSWMGFRGVVGAQWAPAERVRLGISITGPAWVVYRRFTDAQVASAFATENEASAPFLPETTEGSEFLFATFAPLRVRAGASYEASTWWLAVEADLQPGISNEELQIDRRAVWNARIGGGLHVGDSVSFGGGLFTDLSADDDPQEFGEAQINYLGFSGGIQYDSRLDLATNESAEKLEFTTTIGIRYAHGRGDLAGLRTAAVDQELEIVDGSLRVNEFTLHIGSALFF